MGVVVPFPVIPRTLPPIADPRYRAGAAAFAKHVLMARGYSELEAKRRAEDEVDRACHRALVDAGFAPLSEYVERST